MQFLIPDTKKKTKFLFGLTAKDLLFLMIAIVLIVLIWWSSMVIAVKIILSVIVLIAAVFSVITIDVQKGWRVLVNFIRYITRRRKWAQQDLTEELEIADYIRYDNGCCTAVIQLNGLNFSILSEDVQNAKIYGLMQLLQELRSGKFIKLEEPIDLRPYVKTNENYIEKCEQNLIKISTERWGANPGNWETLEGTPDDLKKKILQNQNLHFENFNTLNETKKAAYYLLIQETNEETLRSVVDDAVSMLRSIPFLPMTERKSSETINVIATSALAGMFPFVIKELFDVDGSYDT